MELFPEKYIEAQESPKAVVEQFALSTPESCNAIAGGLVDVAKSNLLNLGGFWNENYEIGSTRHTKDPLALVTRQDDPQWSSFCYWVVSALFYADEEGITQRTQSRMPLVYLFGEERARMFRDIITAVGSYGEIYARNVEGEVPRSGPNNLNIEPYGPQHYGPFGI